LDALTLEVRIDIAAAGNIGLSAFGNGECTLSGKAQEQPTTEARASGIDPFISHALRDLRLTNGLRKQSQQLVALDYDDLHINHSHAPERSQDGEQVS
jgi:hypothetical protein